MKASGRAHNKRVERVLFRSALSILLMSIAPQCITITVIKTEKMTKYRTQTTYKIKDSEKTTITDPSQTVQGEAYTIQELLQKHVNGIMPSVGLDPQYDHDDGAELDDDVTMRKPDLDLTDIDSMSEKVRETTNKIKKAKETKRKKARSEQPTDRSSAGAPEAKKGNSEAAASNSEG